MGLPSLIPPTAPAESPAPAHGPKAAHKSEPRGSVKGRTQPKPSTQILGTFWGGGLEQASEHRSRLRSCP